MNARTAFAMVLLLSACPDVPATDDEIGPPAESTDDESDSSSTDDESDSSSTETGDLVGLTFTEVRCGERLCFAHVNAGGSWVRVVDVATLNMSAAAPLADAPCIPAMGGGEVRCIEVMGEPPQCSAGDGEWFAPFGCSLPVGGLDWPAWMCGEAFPVGLAPWDAAGCDDELSTSCGAAFGSASFEIWPSCYIESIAP